MSIQCERNTFSIPVLRPLSRRRPCTPCLRTWNRTPTASSLVYGFKPHLDRSKGASVRGIVSQSLTTESAAPVASVCSMACFMASHACLALPLPLPLLSRVALLPTPTPIAQTGTISMIDSLSPHLIGGLLELCIQAGERAHDGPESRYAHRSLTQLHAASIRGLCRHARHARMRPRGDRFCRPPAAAALSLPARWALSVTMVAVIGRSWRSLAWSGRAQHRHCICSRLGRHGDPYRASVSSQS